MKILLKIIKYKLKLSYTKIKRISYYTYLRFTKWANLLLYFTSYSLAHSTEVSLGNYFHVIYYIFEK